MQVDIDPKGVIDNLEREYLRSLKKGGGLDKSADYIDHAGAWASWDDTGHGSGITHQYRAATDDEKKVMESFNTMRKIITDLRDKK